MTPRDYDWHRAALDRKGVDGQCPMCDHATWTLSGNSVLVHMHTQDTGAVELGNGIESVPMICGNCGYMALFAARVLHDDLKEQDAS